MLRVLLVFFQPPFPPPSLALFFFFHHRDLGEARQHRPMLEKKKTRDQTRRNLVWVDAVDVSPRLRRAVLLLITRGGMGI